MNGISAPLFSVRGKLKIHAGIIYRTYDIRPPFVYRALHRALYAEKIKYLPQNGAEAHYGEIARLKAPVAVTTHFNRRKMRPYGFGYLPGVKNPAPYSSSTSWLFCMRV